MLPCRHVPRGMHTYTVFQGHLLPVCEVIVFEITDVCLLSLIVNFKRSGNIQRGVISTKSVLSFALETGLFGLTEPYERYHRNITMNYLVLSSNITRVELHLL